jgi:hypothetical protein
MSIRSSASNLAEAMKQLNMEWQRTKESWSDVKARDFEQTYLTDMPQHIARAARVIEELDTILKKIKASCE